MEQEARGELEEARRQLDESGGKASELDDVRRQADEARGRVEEAERLKREAGRSESYDRKSRAKTTGSRAFAGRSMDYARNSIARARSSRVPSATAATPPPSEARWTRSERDTRRIAPSGSAPPPPPRTPS